MKKIRILVTATFNKKPIVMLDKTYKKGDKNNIYKDSRLCCMCHIDDSIDGKWEIDIVPPKNWIPKS